LKDFYLDQYIQEQEVLHKEGVEIVTLEHSNFIEFKDLCEEIKNYFQEKAKEDSEDMLEYQKKAILGHEKEVNYYLQLIRDYITSNKKTNIHFPPWYDTLEKAVFHERWGFAGIYEWLGMKSSSCKIIGDRIYFMQNGRLRLQKQSMSTDRLMQLKKALLLGTPEKRLNEPFHEIYMADGTRIEIFNQAKQSAFVFRRYIVNTFTFEEQAKLKTIDSEKIELLKHMVACGFNTGFTGPVRTGKTTFLTTWQSYEDPTLEGVMVETDPEIPLHVIMPTAPIIQLIADNDELEEVIKPMMRSDGDYLIMAEARDGRALNVVVEITKKGTRRVKFSFHSGNPANLPFEVAQLITKQVGGDLWANMIQVAEGFHYIFAFQQMPDDRSVKKLKGIFELRFDPETLLISSHQICRYNRDIDDWEYKCDIGERIEEVGYEENPIAFKKFKNELKRLAELKPMQESNVKVSPYSKLMTIGSRG
jgi:pilus assembly protein CpaF